MQIFLLLSANTFLLRNLPPQPLDIQISWAILVALCCVSGFSSSLPAAAPHSIARVGVSSSPCAFSVDVWARLPFRSCRMACGDQLSKCRTGPFSITRKRSPQSSSSSLRLGSHNREHIICWVPAQSAQKEMGRKEGKRRGRGSGAVLSACPPSGSPARDGRAPATAASLEPFWSLCVFQKVNEKSMSDVPRTATPSEPCRPDRFFGIPIKSSACNS